MSPIAEHTVAGIERAAERLYWEWIRSEAALIDTDGCSGVTGVKVDCCYQHDLEFWYGRDVRDAYRRWRIYVRQYPDASERAWRDADPTTFERANARFRKCHRSTSKWGVFVTIFGWVRWRGVERLSRGAWEKHRQREAETAGV